MANCPKCGKKLKFYNVSQFCPNCGVNLRFYDFESTFYREAKYAELSNAAVHVKIRRLKASFIGSKLTIFRIVTILFPLAALLAPAAVFSLSLAFHSEKVSLSGLGLFQAYSSGTLSYILSMRSSSFAGAAFDSFFKLILLYGVAALLAIALAVMTLLCFISIKNMHKIICVVSGVGIIYSVFAFFFMGCIMKPCKDFEMISAEKSFGFLIIALAFAIMLAVNLIIWIKGIPVEYDEGMTERVEIYHKVKKGEIDVDSLPQPVIETAATRKIDEEIAKEKANLLKHNGKSGDEEPLSEEEPASEKSDEGDADKSGEEGDCVGRKEED